MIELEPISKLEQTLNSVFARGAREVDVWLFKKVNMFWRKGEKTWEIELQTMYRHHTYRDAFNNVYQGFTLTNPTDFIKIKGE